MLYSQKPLEEYGQALLSEQKLQELKQLQSSSLPNSHVLINVSVGKKLILVISIAYGVAASHIDFSQNFVNFFMSTLHFF